MYLFALCWDQGKSVSPQRSINTGKLSTECKGCEKGQLANASQLPLYQTSAHTSSPNRLMSRIRQNTPYFHSPMFTSGDTVASHVHQKCVDWMVTLQNYCFN